MSEHFDSKPDEIRWTDEEIATAIAEMKKRLPVAEAVVAVMRMMRDSYEITRHSANRHIAQQTAKIAGLEAQGEWEPLAPMSIVCDCDESNCTEQLTVDSDNMLCFENDAGYWSIELPDNIRLCRRKEGR